VKNIVADVKKSDVQQAAPAVIKQAQKSNANNTATPGGDTDPVLLADPRPSFCRLWRCTFTKEAGPAVAL
jgi:hypothetical protein